MQKNFEIELIVSSGTVSLKNLSQFKIGLKVLNKSEIELNFDISEAALFVNSKRSFVWDLAVQNGTIVNFKVSPQNSKSVEWPLGKALFEKNGKYKLELQWGAFTKSREVLVSN